MKANSKDKKAQLVGFVGVGLDGKDDEQRLTTSEHFLLVGGSKETHAEMQDTAIRFNEALKRTGKPLHEAPLEVVIELFLDARK